MRDAILALVLLIGTLRALGHPQFRIAAASWNFAFGAMRAALTPERCHLA